MRRVCMLTDGSEAGAMEGRGKNGSFGGDAFLRHNFPFGPTQFWTSISITVRVNQ